MLTFGQPSLKKRHFGRYEGSVPAYVMDSGKDLINIGSSLIIIDLREDFLTMTIGSNSARGSYSILFEGDNYYVLDCKMDGQLGTERIIVYNRGNKISRDGLYPQPSAMLIKTKD